MEKFYIVGKDKIAVPLENKSRWLWEFSKRIVLICSLIYVVERIFSCVAMWINGDLSSLPTMIEQDSDILKTCVFGYFVKAGVENSLKIWTSRLKEPETDGTEG